MFFQPAKPQAATHATAWAHARAGRDWQQRAAAMEAAYELMAMHDHRYDELLKIAKEWAAQSR